MATESITEKDSLYTDLEKKSVKELLLSIHEEDKKVMPAVYDAIPQIEKLVEAIYQRMKKGEGFSIWVPEPVEGSGFSMLPKFHPPMV